MCVAVDGWMGGCMADETVDEREPQQEKSKGRERRGGARVTKGNDDDTERKRESDITQHTQHNRYMMIRRERSVCFLPLLVWRRGKRDGEKQVKNVKKSDQQ